MDRNTTFLTARWDACVTLNPAFLVPPSEIQAGQALGPGQYKKEVILKN
jgi:hypothetical protein